MASGARGQVDGSDLNVTPPTARALWPPAGARARARATASGTPRSRSGPGESIFRAATTPGQRRGAPTLSDDAATTPGQLRAGLTHQEGNGEPRGDPERAAAEEPPLRETMSTGQLTNFVMSLRADLDLEKRYTEHLADSMSYNSDIIKAHSVRLSYMAADASHIQERVRANDMHVKSVVEASVREIKVEMGHYSTIPLINYGGRR